MAILNSDVFMVEATTWCLEELASVIGSTDVEEYNKKPFLTLDIMGNYHCGPIEE